MGSCFETEKGIEVDLIDAETWLIRDVTFVAVEGAGEDEGVRVEVPLETPVEAPEEVAEEETPVEEAVNLNKKDEKFKS